MFPTTLQLSGHMATTGDMQTATCSCLYLNSFHHDMHTEVMIIIYKIFVIKVNMLEKDNDLEGV